MSNLKANGIVGDIDMIISGVIALESKYVDLEYVLQDIYTQGGMDQKLAMECDAVWCGFINDQNPLSSYTRFPSATKLRQTILAIEEEKKGIISRIFTFIVNMLKKLVNFFTGWYNDEEEYRKLKEKEQKLDLERLKDKYTNLKTKAKANISDLLKDYYKDNEENALNITVYTLDVTKDSEILKFVQNVQGMDIVKFVMDQLINLRTTTDTVIKAIASNPNADTKIEATVITDAQSEMFTKKILDILTEKYDNDHEKINSDFCSSFKIDTVVKNLDQIKKITDELYKEITRIDISATLSAVTTLVEKNEPDSEQSKQAISTIKEMLRSCNEGVKLLNEIRWIHLHLRDTVIRNLNSLTDKLKGYCNTKKKEATNDSDKKKYAEYADILA